MFMNKIKLEDLCRSGNIRADIQALFLVNVWSDQSKIKNWKISRISTKIPGNSASWEAGSLRNFWINCRWIHIKKLHIKKVPLPKPAVENKEEPSWLSPYPLCGEHGLRLDRAERREGEFVSEALHPVTTAERKLETQQKPVMCSLWAISSCDTHTV